MFRNWGFLLGEIWLLLLLAALIGLIAGWLIWGRREVTVTRSEEDGTALHDAAREQVRLRSELDNCEVGRTAAERRIATLEADLADAEQRAAASAAAAAAQRVDPPVVAAAPAAAAAMVAPVIEKTRPATLSAAREGRADNLRLIKGIGPKMEALCHRLGFYHFDQIAAWTPAELAWVDDNLEDFKGRATRDNWIAQARDLAAGKPPLPGGAH